MNATPISKSPIRARWAALGAAVAVSLGAGGLGIVQATGPDGASAYVPISPCRLADTRPDTNVGPHTTPLGPDTAVTYDGWGDVPGDCNLPTGSTGLQLNVTAVGATQLTNLRLYPTGTPLPTTSNLNPSPGAAPTPNGVTVTLNGDGQFDVFNRFGHVDVVIDVAGYYTDHDHDDRYYTKTQTDAAIAASAGQPQNPIDAYTKDQTDAAIDNAVAGKANATDVYTQPETDAALATKASRIETVIINQTAFVALVPTTSINCLTIFGTYVTAGESNQDYLRAPLSIPVGSTITSVTYHYIDNSTSEVWFAITGSNVATNAGFNEAPFQSTGAVAEPRSATVIPNLQISGGRSYAVQVTSTGDWKAAGNNLTVKAVQITYTLP